MSKILYIFDHEDGQSRLPLAHGAKEKGYDVIIGLIGGTGEILEGFQAISIPKPAGSLNPFSLLQTKCAIQKLIKTQRPDLLHTVTLKYAFICGLASLFMPHKKIYTIAGLGYLFRSSGIKAACLQMLVAPLLYLVLRARGTFLIFQNPDDLESMKAQGYVKDKNAFLIRGSGVDLERFKISPDPQNEIPIVLMPTRLVREKGIDIFIEAARIAHSRGVNAKFQIAGGETNHNPEAISAHQMQAMIKGSDVQWLGKVDDMPTLLASVDVIVYPSYYGEGIPRVLLEAAATGKPIITTDHPGCREVVVHNHNGLLVPIKNARETAESLEVLLKDKDKRLAMGKQGRARAEKEFALNLVVSKTLDVYAVAI